MKPFRGFVRIMNALIAIGVAVAAILWWAGRLNLSMEAVEIDAIRDAQMAAFALGVLVLTLNIINIILSLRGGHRPQYLIFEKEGSGSLKVAMDAIEDTLTKCAASTPEVQEAKVEMVLDKGGKMPKRSIAHCIFTDVPNLFAVQESVRQALTRRYQEIFPGEELVFEIVVDRLRPTHEPSKRRKAEEPKTDKEEGDDKPFGPKYPIDGD